MCNPFVSVYANTLTFKDNAANLIGRLRVRDRTDAAAEHYGCTVLMDAARSDASF